MKLCVIIFYPLLIYLYYYQVMVYVYLMYPPVRKKSLKDTKGVIRIRISKKNRQHNRQKKKYKTTNNDLQNIHIKLKIE